MCVKASELVRLQPTCSAASWCLQHHSNLVPWQLLAERTGCVLKFVGLDASEALDMEQMRSLVGSKTKLISVAHVSNTLG